MQTRLYPALLALLGAAALTGCPADGPADDDDSVANDDDTANGLHRDNSWYSAAAEAVPTEAGDPTFAVGEVPPDLEFTDQFGDTVSLHQFTGRLVLLYLGATWCGPCHVSAPKLEEFWQAEGPDGAIVLTVLLEGETPNSGTTDPATVPDWIDRHSATNPVLFADGANWSTLRALLSSWPKAVVIDHDMRTREVGFDLDFIQLAASSAGNPGEVEDCYDAIDNDVDLATDCADDDCADAVGCEVTESLETIEPCGSTEAIVDVWRIESDIAVELTADTVSMDDRFETVVYEMSGPEADPSTWTLLGDEEVPCTFRPEENGCASVELPAGTHILAIGGGPGGYDGDADCQDPALGSYALVVRGEATVTLVTDDLRTGPDPSPQPANDADAPAAPGTIVIVDPGGATTVNATVGGCGEGFMGWEVGFDAPDGAPYDLFSGQLNFLGEPAPGFYWAQGNVTDDELEPSSFGGSMSIGLTEDDWIYPSPFSGHVRVVSGPGGLEIIWTDLAYSFGFGDVVETAGHLVCP